MHSDTIWTETGIQNRRGASYRSYADGKITNVDLMGRIIAQDICEILLAKESPSANENDLLILREICNVLNVETFEHPIFLMSLAYEFGFMMGGKAVRNSKKREPNPIPSTATEKPRSASLLPEPINIHENAQRKI